MGNRGRPSAGIVDAILVATAICIAWSIAASLDTRAVLDTDAVNLAFSIDRFDLNAHQPHPPGYLGYVLVLRAVHAVTGLGELATVKVASRLFAAIALVMVYLSGRALAPESRAASRLAVALAATNPLLLYYALDGQTHAAECAVAATLVWLLVSDGDRERSGRGGGLGRAIAVGALLAVGGSFRPSFALIAVAPVLWWYRRSWRRLAVIGAVAAAGTVAWLWPTVSMTGGWRAYRAASDALIGTFTRSTSVLSEQRDSRMVIDNARVVAMWAGAVLLPALAALAVTGPRAARSAFLLVALMAAPALAFYAVVFIAEAGYVIGLLPPACVAAGCAVAAGAGWRRWAIGAVAPLQLALFLALPGAPARAHWWFPSIAEIVFRQDSAELIVARIADGEPDEARLLVLSDRGSTAVYRQVPLMRPRTHVLIINSERMTLFDYTTLGLATEDDWLAAPGPALLADGPPTTLTVDFDYDAVVVGPTYTPELAAELRAQTPCEVPDPSPELVTAHLPVARCFPSRELTFAPHRLRWGGAR